MIPQLSSLELEDEAAAEAAPPYDDFWVPVARASLTPPPWIIRDFLCPGLYFISGPPKQAMKTTTMIGMANLVSGHKCGLFPDFMSQVEMPGRVMLLEAEAEPGEIRYMIEQDMGIALSDDESILMARDAAEFRLDDEGALKRLLGWLDRFKPRMFVIDPMREFHGLEERDSGDMQRLLRPLRRWAIKHDAAIVIIHHTSKPNDQHTGVYNPLDMRGSTALFGAANGVLMLSPTKVDGQLVMGARFKRGASWTRHVQLGIFGAPAKEILSKAEEQVLELIRREPRVAAQLVTATETNDRWVAEALMKLQRNKLASVTGNRWHAITPGWR